MQCICNYEFSRAFVGEHLFNFYIDHFFVVCMTNLLLEGQFNLLNHYTDANHDELLREVILQHLNWVLVPERIANREPEMHSKRSSNKTLEKAHRSHKQLTEYGRLACARAKSYTASELNSARRDFDTRSEKRNTARRNEAKAKGEINDNECSSCGADFREVALYECDHLGCPVSHCQACSGWSDEQLTGRYICDMH